MGKGERSFKGGSFAMDGGWRWLSGIVSISVGGGGGGGGGRGRRVRLALALICCSPVLLPLICLSLPVLCIAAFCLRLRQWRRPAELGEDVAAGFLERCEEGEEAQAAATAAAAAAIEGRLLHRYLEDQLGLVRAVWDCDDGGDLAGL
ncbi:uncharacterized protein [Elaeis guineensis]|uniref:Uncharacterized protein LOC105038403 n=1 Tax=Elaeis guineensis var. tenera TaxID=51953 RepID=A0A6I9QQP8_ELAGV|nr:uncharacterized protein LOC105038403 [Elaeis guineensis]